MAKELPYFKFEPTEWMTGNITLCTMEAQGLFLNICNLYWSRLGELRLDQIRKRFQQYDQSIDEMIAEDVLKVDIEDNIIITFLDDQLEEREALNKRNQINGAKGGRPKKPKENPKKTQSVILEKPTDNPSLTQTKGNRIEENKKEKKREEKNRNTHSQNDISLNANTTEVVTSTKKKFIKPELNEVKDYFFEKIQNSNSAFTEAEKFIDHYTANGWKVGRNSMKDWKAAVRNWCKNIKTYDRQDTKKQSATGDEIMRSIARKHGIQ